MSAPRSRKRLAAYANTRVSSIPLVMISLNISYIASFNYVSFKYLLKASSCSCPYRWISSWPIGLDLYCLFGGDFLFWLAVNSWSFLSFSAYSYSSLFCISECFCLYASVRFDYPYRFYLRSSSFYFFSALYLASLASLLSSI